MTRDEAIQKFFQIMYPNSTSREKDMVWATKAITAYEALGFVKFETVRSAEERVLDALRAVVVEIDRAPFTECGSLRLESAKRLLQVMLDAGFYLAEKQPNK